MVKKSQIYLAGGCFWGVEAYFKRVDGIISTKVGYANGSGTAPSYEKVCSGIGNFAETVFIEYDSDKISLSSVIKRFFDIIDPTTLNRQAFDVGVQYRSGIYYTDEQDIRIIEDIIKEKAKKYSKPIVVEIKKLENFYDAEEYHQKYLDKNPSGYCHINLAKAYDYKEE